MDDVVAKNLLVLQTKGTQVSPKDQEKTLHFLTKSLKRENIKKCKKGFNIFKNDVGYQEFKYDLR